MGLIALLPSRRKSYSGFLLSDKIHRPRPGSNPRTSDPEANVYVNNICNIQGQQQKYINELVLENSVSLFNKKLSYIRGTHRLHEYNKWCQLQVHGKGVILFHNTSLLIHGWNRGWNYPAQNGMMLLNSKEILPL